MVKVTISTRVNGINHHVTVEGIADDIGIIAAIIPGHVTIRDEEDKVVGISGSHEYGVTNWVSDFARDYDVPVKQKVAQQNEIC